MELLVHAEKILGLREAMLDQACGADTVTGVLRLGVAETIVHTGLAQFVKAMNGAYPNLTIEVEVDTTSIVARPPRRAHRWVTLQMITCRVGG